jgi:DNA-binding NarL/FixJ family response regulator
VSREDADPVAMVEESIRVVIADDHVLYRRGLQMVVSQEDDIDIVGEAGDGKEAVDRTVELLPDVVLMDVRMPFTPARPSRHSCPPRRSSC